jgi:hypothetical protein
MCIRPAAADLGPHFAYDGRRSVVRGGAIGNHGRFCLHTEHHHKSNMRRIRAVAALLLAKPVNRFRITAVTAIKTTGNRMEQNRSYIASAAKGIKGGRRGGKTAPTTMATVLAIDCPEPAYCAFTAFPPRTCNCPPFPRVARLGTRLDFMSARQSARPARSGTRWGFTRQASEIVILSRKPDAVCARIAPARLRSLICGSLVRVR